MRLTIVRSRLVRDACTGCGKRPEECGGNELWTMLQNVIGERVCNVCPDCSTTWAHAYLKQKAQQQAAMNNPPAPAPAFMRPEVITKRRRRPF